MKTISVIALKGGTGKTTTSVNMSSTLAAMGKRILLIDNDKQGNASKHFRRHSWEQKGTAELMTERRINMHSLIQHTEYEGLDIITANMNLLTANLKVMLDQVRPQQTRFKNGLAQITEEYDYCIIDNAPDINISTINALVASDDVIIPVIIDDYSIEGLAELTEQIENTKEDLNEKLNFLGCLVTQFDKVNDTDGIEHIKALGYPVLDTVIHKTPKVKESTFARVPLAMHSKRCKATKDYQDLVAEYIAKMSESDRM